MIINESLNRIVAISIKEWRLNTRFITEYIASNLVGPIKSAVIMYFIYAGLLKNGSPGLGLLTGENFTLYVLIGTTCHNLFISSLYIFRSKMVTERWWQTITATLISPANALEVIAGYISGSGSVNIILSISMLGLLSFLFSVPFSLFVTASLVLLLLALFSFGIGLIGATLVLCWEGKSFLFDYCIQALIFLSCFYYPVEALPSKFHPLVQALPTFRASQLIQQLLLTGSADHVFLNLCYLAVCAVTALVLPALWFDRSVKTYGIMGY